MWEASENMDCDLKRCYFSALLSLSSITFYDADLCIIRERYMINDFLISNYKIKSYIKEVLTKYQRFCIFSFGSYLFILLHLYF